MEVDREHIGIGGVVRKALARSTLSLGEEAAVWVWKKRRRETGARDI